MNVALLAALAPLVLEPCSLPDVEGEARCGYYEVFEDRGSRTGRRIALFVAILPATSRPAAPDPLFVIAGGPGQGASSLAPFVNDSLQDLRRRRDLVFVDVAGTGRSGALDCDVYRTPGDLVGDFFPMDRMRACRKTLESRTDLRRYLTSILMDDLDEVRAVLGYESINLYGTSYGSRAALEYLRKHGDRVRAVVMKAIVPPTLRGTMHYARDMDRSLGMLIDACRDDAACAAAYPNFDSELRQILERAGRGKLAGRVPDPQGGAPQELPITRGAVASAILGQLQSSHSAVHLPFVVHRAHQGDTEPLVRMIVDYRRALVQNISYGMHLSVMCSEDEPRMDAAAAARNDRGTALGDYRVAQLVAACREWVRGRPPATTGTPVISDVPALLVSGTLDPNTNEHWGEEAMRGLSNATHVVIPNLSHAFTSIRQCGARFITQFIEQASMDGVDVSCKDRVRLPPFLLPGQPGGQKPD